MLPRVLLLWDLNSWGPLGLHARLHFALALPRACVHEAGWRPGAGMLRTWRRARRGGQGRQRARRRAHRRRARRRRGLRHRDVLRAVARNGRPAHEPAGPVARQACRACTCGPTTRSAHPTNALGRARRAPVARQSPPRWVHHRPPLALASGCRSRKALSRRPPAATAAHVAARVTRTDALAAHLGESPSGTSWNAVLEGALLGRSTARSLLPSEAMPRAARSRATLRLTQRRARCSQRPSSHGREPCSLECTQSAAAAFHGLAIAPGQHAWPARSSFCAGATGQTLATSADCVARHLQRCLHFELRLRFALVPCDCGPGSPSCLPGGRPALG